MRRVVYLSLAPSPQPPTPYFNSLSLGLREFGYVEGRNLVLEYRHADGQIARLPEVARSIVHESPDVIVTGVNAITRVVQQATRTIPVVMIIGTDVVKEGFVASLSRPGGNITGLSWDAGGELYSKRLEYLKDAIPNLARVAVIWDVGQDAASFRRVFDEHAVAAGWQVVWLDMVTEDLEPLFAQAVREGAQALITGGGTRLFRQRARVAALAAKYRLPDAHYEGAFVDAGGLMSYSPSLKAQFKRSATYVYKILNGANPAELPVERPTQFELVLNLKTAHALGLNLPQALLLRADRLVQ